MPSCCGTAVKIPSKFDLPSTAKNLPSKNEKQSTPKKLPSCCVTVPSESVKNIVTEHLFSSFSSRSYPPVRKRTDHCGMNMSTNIALKTRTRCFSFDQYVRKCNDSLVVNMMVKKSLYFRTEWYLLCYCCCVKHPAHRNSKSRVHQLRCQDSGPPTPSYTAAAAAGVAVRCCCCCGVGTRTHTRTCLLYTSDAADE